MEDPTAESRGKQPGKEKAQRKRAEGTRQVWTRGRNMQAKETAPPYRLQMPVIIRIGTGEVVSKYLEQTAEMIQAMAVKASVMLFQKGGVKEVVEAISSILGAPHIDGDAIRKYFGRRRRVEGAEVLERIT